MLDPHVQAVGIDPGSLCCEIDPLTFFIDNFFFYTQSILPSVCGVQQRHTFCLSFSSIFFLFSHSLFSPLLNRSSVNIARFSRPYAWEPVCYTNDELSTNASLHSPHVSPSPHSFCLSSALASMWPHYSHPKAQGSIYTCLCNTEKRQFKTQKYILFLFFFFFPSFFCGRMSPQRLLCGPSGHFWIFSLIIILYLELNRPLSTDFLFCVWIAINTSCLSWFSAWLPDSLARYCLLI